MSLRSTCMTGSSIRILYMKSFIVLLHVHMSCGGNRRGIIVTVSKQLIVHKPLTTSSTEEILFHSEADFLKKCFLSTTWTVMLSANLFRLWTKGLKHIGDGRLLWKCLYKNSFMTHVLLARKNISQDLLEILKSSIQNF